MKKVAVLGAGGQIARWLIKELAGRKDVQMTLFLRHANRIKGCNWEMRKSCRVTCRKRAEYQSSGTKERIMEHVRIQNPDMAWHIAANILFPPDFDKDQTYPTVVALHPFGSCKEQTAGNVYGPALAKEGFVVIVYDASFQGESGGAPRWVEDPTQRVEDVSRVIDYAVTLPYVDADRIGVLGVCGGGGYALNSTLTEKRIKAVVSITGVNIGRLFREDFSQFNPLGALDAMAAHRTAEARGEEPQVNELLPANQEAAKASGQTDRDVIEATDYYKTPRGESPGGPARMLFSHAQKTLAWDAFGFAETLLTQPVMVVIGQKVGSFGAFRDGMEIYGRATASKDRQLVSLEHASHYDLYDKPEAVAKALEKAVPFFKKHLGFGQGMVGAIKRVAAKAMS